MASNGVTINHGPSSTPVDPNTFWAERYGPIYRLRNYFSGSRSPFSINIEHYENQHSINGRRLLLNIPPAYDSDKAKEIVHGCGETAFNLLFHMGVTPVAHVWDGLFDKLSDPPQPIDKMTSAELAQFLGVDMALEKDTILTQFVAIECEKNGYRVPEALPFCHDFKVFELEPPACNVGGCHTCTPIEDSHRCDCVACQGLLCYCSGCKALRNAQLEDDPDGELGEPCAVCKELNRDFDAGCPTCRNSTPSPPSTPGADLKTLDTEEEYLEYMEMYKQFSESEKELWGEEEGYLMLSQR